MRTPVVPAAPPLLDARQRAVVEHRAGPLLVLGGPGTGRTTALVEAVTARARAGTPPERILVLTFHREAALDLRDRIAARLGSDTPGSTAPVAPQALTFHSYCYGLLRAHQPADRYAEPVRLLSGPEQDLMVRELLAGQIELVRDGRARVRWPDELRAALTTRGFADEVRAVLARSRELGLAPEALRDFARRIGRPDWRAAADLLAEYLDVTDLQGVIDYTELVHRAVRLARRPDVHAELARRYDAVYVDEYQDTDPAQVRLLRALAGGGRTLVAFGDPDQAIYAFRGADVNAILDFPERFPRRDGGAAPIVVLTGSHRATAPLLAATRQLSGRLPLPRLPAAVARAHRFPTPIAEGRPAASMTAAAGPAASVKAAFAAEGGSAGGPGGGAAGGPAGSAVRGAVAVRTYPTPGAEVDSIADVLRRAHLEENVPWADMAVLVRSGAALPALRRALMSSGVPVDLASSDAPLHAEPAVAPLLLALRVAAESAGPDRAARRGSPAGASGTEEGVPGGGAGDAAGASAGEGGAADGAPQPAVRLRVEDAVTLLTSPLGGMDAADLRRLGRALREEERAAGQPVPRPSDVLIAEAVAEPERLATYDQAYARGAVRLGRLLREAARSLRTGGTAEEALWGLWAGSPWSGRLERAALRGGPAGRNADRDLDAVCALFETAARAEERTGGRGALNLIEELSAFDIAADTRTASAVRPGAVRLTTAHRAKGHEWRLVVVAGVQEGVWPDLRRRGSLLEADRIGRDGLAPPLSQGALLTEERRLFYVAATRARERLLVTAVKAAADDGDQPSRFLAELGVQPQDVTHRPRRPLAVAALVAELRATTVDPAASLALREAAAQRLARMAALDDDGHPLVPAAHPERWWGLYEPTRSAVPLRDREQPVVLSGSALDQLANTCALQWFLGREVKAEPPSTAAQGFGNVVHVLADEVGSGRTPADLDVLMARLDSVWDALAFDAPWKSRQEKENARAALERFLRWHVMERGRTIVAGEHTFDVTLDAGEARVRIRGSMDRVETDAEGQAYVVDFKTGRAKPTAAEVAHHPQLAVYQLAVREGAVDSLFGEERPRAGGAELVQLRLGATKRDGGDTLPVVQRQGPLDGPGERGESSASGEPGASGEPAGQGGWAEDLLARAAGRVLDERFTPAAGQHCAHCAFRASCTAQPEGRHIVE
ncbi:ATP-dependent helicase [Streptomyces sp. NBC_01190]|uniref:ATP-dependent helicase n=1 Tax=Streptomyces sp. NBC_01190 TaxID=2903767 RepID=UPI00386B2A31|nr:ATP-dependent helicase [Streptomyces sp. NBC_01190]